MYCVSNKETISILILCNKQVEASLRHLEYWYSRTKIPALSQMGTLWTMNRLILYENIKPGLNIIAVRELASRGVWGLLMVLVEYESNGNRWRIRERMKWIVCNSDQTHRYYRLLPVMQKFFWVWTIKNQWLLDMLSLAMLRESRKRSKQRQSS